MPRLKYTPAERALHIIGALAGKNQQEINDVIAKGDALKQVPTERRKDIPQGSINMLKNRYATTMGVVSRAGLGEDFWSELWEHCTGPKKAGDLPKKK